MAYEEKILSITEWPEFKVGDIFLGYDPNWDCVVTEYERSFMLIEFNPIIYHDRAEYVLSFGKTFYVDRQTKRTEIITGLSIGKFGTFLRDGKCYQFEGKVVTEVPFNEKTRAK